VLISIEESDPVFPPRFVPPFSVYVSGSGVCGFKFPVYFSFVIWQSCAELFLESGKLSFRGFEDVAVMGEADPAAQSSIWRRQTRWPAIR